MRHGLLSVVACAALVVACGRVDGPSLQPGLPESPKDSSARTSVSYFEDITDTAGIDFRHHHGGSGRKYLPEIMGAGGCALDYNGDRRIDLFFVQSDALPGSGSSAGGSGNELWRNEGGGRFSKVDASDDLSDLSYGMGAVCADYDNDGDPDIFIAAFGLDRLLRNEGEGRFVDVTATAGIDNPRWGSSATFFDADHDGWLDLYVVNYLDFDVESHVDCGAPARGMLSYCHPDVYPMAPDVFFRNRGDGTFEDATAQAGLVDTSGKGLGVVAGDFDNDGWSDLYVANDSTPNFLWRNRGDGTFEEVALLLGVGHNEDGKTEAGMGTDAGDIDGDGFLDLLVTNLNNESNALYLGGEMMFSYHSRLAQLVEPSFMLVGFGVDLADFDNDGDLDLVVANGHVIDNIELTDDAQSFRQPGQVFVNEGDAEFRQLVPHVAGDLSEPRVGRGTITLDFDDDGRLDLAITYNDDRARLFHNQAEAHHWIGFLLESSTSNRDGVGARVTVESAARSQLEERRAGSSYQTSGDPRLHFGLGGAESASRVTVKWPSGSAQTFEDLEADRYYRIEEGKPAAVPLP